MPKRPERAELAGRLAREGRGREAFAASTSSAPPSGRDEGKERWEDTHTRVTFHCSVALRDAVEEEVRRSGRSKSRVIVDALRADLGVEA